MDPPARKRRAIEPVNYVAGLGRGATGFTTRSDIGDARLPSGPAAGVDGAAGGANPVGYVAGRGRGASGFSKQEDEEAVGQDDGSANLEGESLFRDSDYDNDDKEADMVWDEIDDKMEMRRKKQKEEQDKLEREQYRKSRPKIQTLFQEEKKQLASVSYEEWDAIADIGDRSLKWKQKRQERYTPAPDSLLEQAKKENSFVGQVAPTPIGGDTPAGNMSTMGSVTDLKALGGARKTMLDTKLKAASDSVTGQTSIDPKGMLTDLAGVQLKSDAEIGDIKKARLLLDSVTNTNPKHAPGWIARARLEEAAGKQIKARQIISEGCENCPTNQDVWLEAARLNTPDVAKTLLARAVQFIPDSVKIWQEAASLEKDPQRKKRVLRKALEIIPNSPLLWKEAIQLEEPDDARIMLSRAVECVPHSTQMWLALAKLETYENAKKVLNKARQTIPTDRAIWITAAQLEEANGNPEGVKIVIKKAIKSLAQHGADINREAWISEAEKAEKSGSPVTCQAIVFETIGMGIEDVDRKSTWVEDAEQCISRGSIQTARAIYANATKTFPGKKSLWLDMARLEKNHGSRETLEQTLKQAVRYCPKAEILWLMAAKEQWLAGNLSGARDIIREAYDANPDSEQIWLAAVKLEKENDEWDRARALLNRARENAATGRVWMKSAMLERELGNNDAERSLLTEALVKFPDFPKLWMMLGQLNEREQKYDEAKRVYNEGLKTNPKSIPLWLCLSRLEEKTGGASKARSTLEKARVKNPANDQLWLESVRVEQRSDNKKMATTVLAKALQEVPNSGILLAEQIEIESKPQKKRRVVDALKITDNDPAVLLAVIKVFWEDRLIEKARSWFERAIIADSSYGDTWAAYFKFETQYGNEEQRKKIIERCLAADPHHGEKWIAVSKDPKNWKLKPEEILRKVALTI